jgi:hypothetical protein
MSASVLIEAVEAEGFGGPSWLTISEFLCSQRLDLRVRALQGAILHTKAAAGLPLLIWDMLPVWPGFLVEGKVSGDQCQQRASTPWSNGICMCAPRSSPAHGARLGSGSPASTRDE